MFCPNCGKENPNDAKFCSACGAALAPYQPKEEGAPPQQQPAQGVVHFPGIAAPSQRPPREKKNTTALVLGILGAVCSFLGGLLWASCADMINCSEAMPEVGNMWVYTALFVVLGIGGSVVTLIGSIQAFNYGHGRFVLSLIGLLCQLGCLAAQVFLLMSMGGKGYFLSLGFTVIALILLLAETVFSAIKNPNRPKSEP